MSPRWRRGGLIQESNPKQLKDTPVLFGVGTPHLGPKKQTGNKNRGQVLLKCAAFVPVGRIRIWLCPGLICTTSVTPTITNARPCSESAPVWATATRQHTRRPMHGQARCPSICARSTDVGGSLGEARPGRCQWGRRAGGLRTDGPPGKPPSRGGGPPPPQRPHTARAGGLAIFPPAILPGPGCFATPPLWAPPSQPRQPGPGA